MPLLANEFNDRLVFYNWVSKIYYRIFYEMMKHVLPKTELQISTIYINEAGRILM